MQKKFLIVNIFLLLFCMVFAINISAAELYINTNPIDSKVFIDGILVGKSPIRMKIKEKRSIYIGIVKDGYKKLDETITLADKRIINLHYDLTPDKIELIFRDKGKIINICGMPVGETPAILYNVPNGMYEIVKNDNSYEINPAGYKYAIRSTVVESIYSGGMLSLFLLGMNNTQKSGDNVGAAVTGFGSVIMSTILGYDILKLFKIIIASERAKNEIKTIKYKPYEKKDDRVLFTQGVSLLGQKNYNQAIEKFSMLTKLYSDSQYVPISYYELGLAYYNLKDYRAASDVLYEFLHKYPVYEVYQYAFYYYIDSMVKLNEYERAFVAYNKYKPTVIEDESGLMYKKYFNVLVKLYNKDRTNYKEILKDILNYIDYYTEEYSNSSAYPEIMVKKAEILYRYVNRKKGQRLIEDLQRIYGKDKKIIKELENIIRK